MGDISFTQWVRTVINPQADPGQNNAVALDDFSRDGMAEYCYPKEFTVNGDVYRWTVSTSHTPRRHLCTHHEIWFFGPAFGAGRRVATGSPDKTKVRRGLRIIYQFYKG